MKLAIVCGSGGYRTVFIHGVLSAFEQAGLRAEAYAGTSASVLATASAALGQTRAVGVAYWQRALDIKRASRIGMSEVSLTTIAEKTSDLVAGLFAPSAPRFLVPACAVVTPAGAEETQGAGARKLGRKLLLEAARRTPSAWVREHLRLDLFDTRGTPALTPANFAEVAYASSRMMHAWDIPASIEGRPYVDASYLCSIPVEEVGRLGLGRIIAISADPPQTRFADMFGTRTVPERVGATPVYFISPQIDPATLGADFTDATHEGLSAAYAHGEELGRAFCAEFG